MTQQTPDTASVVERTRRYGADGTIVAAHFLGASAIFVVGEEALLLARDGEARRIRIHAGAVLASAADGERIVTGGDDGEIGPGDIVKDIGRGQEQKDTGKKKERPVNACFRLIVHESGLGLGLGVGRNRRLGVGGVGGGRPFGEENKK